MPALSVGIFLIADLAVGWLHGCIELARILWAMHLWFVNISVLYFSKTIFYVACTGKRKDKFEDSSKKTQYKLCATCWK